MDTERLTKIQERINEENYCTLRHIVFARKNIILTLVSLLLAVLVVASFNEKIIPVTPVLKIWLVVLLSIIPVAMWDYDIKLAEGENYIFKKLGVDKSKCESAPIEEIMAGSAQIYMTLLSIVIVAIIDFLVPSIVYTLGIAFFDFIVIALIYWFHLIRKK